LKSKETENDVEKIPELQKVIGYTFNDIGLLKHALTHSSYANEMMMSKMANNERLEFLGDAVLELLSSEYLFDNYKDLPEGRLTKMRAALVSEGPLAQVAREIGLNEYLLLSKGENQTGGRERDSIISDAVEALLGAIYLDGGMEGAREFVYKFIVNDIENKELFNDSKSILQEIVQKYKLGCLEYEGISETGPEHDKEYTIACVINDKIVGQGKGRNKKSAEQHAAYEAIKNLKTLHEENLRGGQTRK